MVGLGLTRPWAFWGFGLLGGLGGLLVSLGSGLWGLRFRFWRFGSVGCREFRVSVFRVEENFCRCFLFAFCSGIYDESMKGLG